MTPWIRIKNSLNWLLPGYCLLCQKATKALPLCADCNQDLPHAVAGCKSCANPLVHATQEALCGECLKQPPPFDYATAVFYYRPPIDHLVLTLKFQQKLAVAKLAGILMARHLENFYQQGYPDWIIPVPLHPLRMKERGYNQAVELSKPIAHQLQIPLNLTACRRIVHTLPQAMIPAEQRSKNIKQAFVVEKNFAANHIIIIDDVITTGQTVRELAHCFKKMGVARIDIGCFAKTKLDAH